MNNEEKELIKEIDVKVDRELFYSPDSNYGIYAVTPILENEKIKLNKYGNMSLKGVMQRLMVDAEYKIDVSEVKDKYGVGYMIENMHQEIPTSIEGQRAYLSTILTSLQVDSIYKVYDDGQDVLQLFKDNTFEYEKVYNFGKIVYDRVREKVLDNLDMVEALSELSPYGINFNMISKLVKHYNGNTQLAIQTVRTNPYKLTEVDGIGFDKADKIALKMGIEEDSPLRIDACIYYMLDKATMEGHCWLFKNKVISEVNNEIGIGKKKITSFMKELEENYGKEHKKKYYMDDKRIALFHLYRYELAIYNKTMNMINCKRNERLIIKDVEEKIKRAEQEQGFEFTEEQKNGIREACDKNVLVINGKAGTGKTTMLKGIIKVLSYDSPNIMYETCALSGKAAQRITESTGLKSSTMHRLLGFDGTGFAFHSGNPLQGDVFVNDEGSMVNSYIFYSFEIALPQGSMLIILGDTEQLEPIGAGRILGDLIESGKVPSIVLTQVHRQAMKSGILSTANQVREGIQFAKKGDYKNRVLGELKDLHFKPYSSSEKVFNQIIKTCEGFMEKMIETGKASILDFQVIVPLKERGDNCTKKLNEKLQEIFNPEFKPVIERNGIKFKEDDKIIQQGNNYDDNVFNGTLGIIQEVNLKEEFVIIDFQGVGTVKYSKQQMGQIDLAYALSIHSVQGSQMDYVVIGLDYAAYKLLSRQLVYTALTRAVKLCILICELDALIHAVDTNKTSKRNTFLLEFFQKNEACTNDINNGTIDTGTVEENLEKEMPVLW